ncbi:MAG: mannitol-1-phosphate 5-dehydrogenase [Actinomycetaceae bacterium]|nr:mannitol-1-phosphate 5-dehydrogenase [Actinomycetaceae bacterium]
MSAPIVVAWGAGSVGRGFIGDLFSAAGWQIVFVDMDARLIDAIQRDGGYPHETVDTDCTNRRDIRGATAIFATDQEAIHDYIARASLVTTSVGSRALPAVAQSLAAALRYRWDQGGGAIDVFLCENLHGAEAYMRALIEDAIGEEHIERSRRDLGLIETVISRMIPPIIGEEAEREPTLIRVEPYRILPYAALSLKASEPAVDGLIPVRDVDFSLYTDRKLFVHNLGHCVCAYLGDLLGTRYIWEAIAIPEVRHITQATMTESLAALSGSFGVTPLPLLEHSDDLLARFTNRALGDTNERVGRDPERKMAREDRFLGAYRLAVSSGAPRGYLSLALALGGQKLSQQQGWDVVRARDYVRREIQDAGGDDQDCRLFDLQWEALASGWDWGQQVAFIDRHVRNKD